MGLCVAVAAVLRAVLPASEFTLAWTHSVEKIRWEEDYVVSAQALTAVAARVRGSGAGMDPPAGATLRQGVWHYRPDLAAQPRLHLAVSPYTTDYDLCWRGGCKHLGELAGLPADGGVVELYGCPYPEGTRAASMTPSRR